MPIAVLSPLFSLSSDRAPFHPVLIVQHHLSFRAAYSYQGVTALKNENAFLIHPGPETFSDLLMALGNKQMRGARMENLCVMCKVREVSAKGVDRSKPAVNYKNRVDKLTSTVSWTTVFSRYCYFCDKKNDRLIKL